VSELERVADSDRERAVAALREHTVAGRLTLEELAERVGIALAARTRAELGGAVADLPSMTAAAELPDEEASVLGLFGNVTRTGRWRLGRRVRARGIFGGVRLDLRHAEVTADEVWVDVRAICGEVSVVVPHGVALDMAGYAAFGEQHADAGDERVPAGAPVVHVRARTAFGKLTVRRG
jgi:uncharacterized protein DUF1707/cell wall-active antibiotic response 4TMS protein YvqF